MTSTGSAVSLSLGGPKNMIAVVRVSTNRGEYVFRGAIAE